MAFREPRWSEITAVFGGAFDPPHAGHREAVAGLFALPGARSAIVLPTGTPALKSEHTSAEHRLQMARLAFDGGRAGEIRVDDREVRRAGPSYTFDTLRELRRESGAELAFVIGTDQLESLPRWHRFPEILGLAHWIVLERKPDGAARIARAMAELEASGLARKASDSAWELLPASGPGTCLKRVPTGARELSSTAIRRDLALKSTEFDPTANGLDPVVWQYLKENRLYGTREPHV